MKHLQQYIGILLGAAYGLGYRFLYEFRNIHYMLDFNIYSVSFVWVLPIVIGIIPILFAHKEVLESRSKQWFFPFLSVFLFFLGALSSGVEDWLCLLIIALPFLVAAGFTGLIAGWFIKRWHTKKLYSLLLLPFVLNPIEASLPNHRAMFRVQSTVYIQAPKHVVWANLIEVPAISNDEFDQGFFNFIGVPRPVKSKLETVNGQTYRVGYFTDGLKLYESITEIDSLHFVNFKIHLNKSKLRDLPTDKHLLGSNYFRFENISYKMVKSDKGHTQLTLGCDYVIESKMNRYANFWANQIIKDFEVRLLNALKKKIEKQVYKKIH